MLFCVWFICLFPRLCSFSDFFLSFTYSLISCLKQNKSTTKSKRYMQMQGKGRSDQRPGKTKSQNPESDLVTVCSCDVE